MTIPNALIEDIRTLLDRGGDQEATLEAVLAKVLEAFQCPVGTIHSLDPASGMLKLRALKGIPPSILDKVRVIPIGKGMAGIAAERKQPVQVCNLQTDASGVAKPSAKDTKMEGSITVPMLQQGNLRGTLGVAKPVPYEFSEDETRVLMEAGSLISGYLK
jgi:L-methionine (R)-S-oxide reductase